jgi:hypothetical protein
MKLTKKEMEEDLEEFRVGFWEPLRGIAHKPKKEQERIWKKVLKFVYGEDNNTTVIN